jgi:hypothetical protein
METTRYPTRTLIIEEIAHIVLNNRAGVVHHLKVHGIEFVDTSPNIVKAVFDNMLNADLNSAILNLLSRKPYNRGCIHCIDPISDLVKQARAL